MKIVTGNVISKRLIKAIFWAVLVTAFFQGKSVLAAPDYMFFSVNGDTTVSSMTQGDELFWGSNSDTGATINWTIWYDVNSNSVIDPSIDYLLMSENITDGNPLTEADPILDGWTISGAFNLSIEPGNYIFKAIDIDTDEAVQDILTMVAMSSPPNQFTGQISLPGISPPNSLLANRVIFAESETGDEGAFGAFTNNMGQYSINLGDNATGVEFYLDPSNIPNYVAPDYISAIASGVVGNNDFTYADAVDSVWGFVKDESGSLLSFETNVSARSNWSEKYVTTSGSRYVIYFSSSEKGDWSLESDSRNSPVYLTQEQFNFNNEVLGSFQHDIILTKSNAKIYARITENGALPVNNYRIDAYSSSLSSWAESVSGTGSDNVVGIGVSTLDNSGWQVSIAQYDDDFPIPNGFIPNPSYFNNLSPGDTVLFNLVSGYLVGGIITQDPEDGPINWDEVWISVGDYGANANDGGEYAVYTDMGMFFMGVYADGYITNPAWREVNVTGDTTGAGLGFVINETHCRVSGALTNVSLPLDASHYYVAAQTGSDGTDGYYVSAQVDSATGTYTMNLCDGDWTITPPNMFFDLFPPDAEVITIGESPDTVRTVDFEYVSNYVCGDANNDGGVNISDAVYLINLVFRGGPDPDPLCQGDSNGDGGVNISDAVYLINLVFRGGNPPIDGCCL